MKPAVAALLSTVLLTISIGRAQADNIDDFVEAQRKQQHIPGLSLAVMQDGRIVRAQGYGLANVELDVKAAPQTVFQSGSVGKQFTATLVMMLVEQGRIGLDDPIDRYFKGAPDIWKPITVRNLLTHTSGIKDYESGGIAIDLRRDYTDDELVAKAAAMPLDFPPGEQWKYSNTGYVLLGILIKQVSGRFYGDLLSERIFKPLEMGTARIIDEADIIPNRAAGYALSKENQLKNQEYVSPSLNRTADGSLYFTVLDLAKWDAALYTETLLKKQSLALMWTPVKLNSGATESYGFGWRIAGAGTHRNIEHSGAWQGFTSHISRYIDDRLTVVVLTNLAGCHPEQIAHGVAELYRPALKPTGIARNR